MASLKYLKDKLGTVFLPITHFRAVRNDDGDNIEDVLRDNFYTEAEVNDLLSGKEDTISDLADIRSGAALGATALQSFTESDPTVPSWAKQSTKPSYTAAEVGALPDSTTIPTKVSELTNDSGFTTNTGTITGITMNGASKGTSGVVNLGTVLTEHQSLAGKQNVISDLATIRSGASAGATAYQKPSTGIPKTDLASAVQTSLGKADTALQSHQDISGKANIADVYTKTEVNNLITTPNQEYVSVAATDQTTSVTDVLPATGAADTTYRIGNWDGTQYNDSAFSEYAWDGSAYIKLSTKSQVGEVYDISANHADTKYADLAAALNGGANIPQSLQKGGMSVKFVRSSDNKYVQYRLMSDTFNTTVANWQGVDDEPTAGSDNLVKSGGVQNELALGVVYDVSAKNPTAGPNNDGKWDSLSALLSDANLETLVPPAYRKGGMSIKFICSADNEYEQHRYMGTAVTGTPNPFLNVLNWQENTEKYINNTKYLYIVKGKSDKLFIAIDLEGNVVFGNGCPKQIKKLIKPLLDFFSETEDDIKERLELTLDQNDNLLSWRDKDGTKHEAVFAAGKFVFSDANKRQLVNALKDVNYGNQTDWSDASNIAIPIPRCAKINVTNISSMPPKKTTNSRAIVQFWDMQGNTFTKTATLNAQGQHSLSDPKKNISIDLHDHNWEDDFTVKFGDWVPQSSFHIKSYWLDWSRVVGPVNYDIIEQVDKSRGILKDRSWKRALMTSDVTASSDLDVRMDTGAKCHPMGFPCIIYLNSEFYGIFIWQLKKHRDNYHMEKDNPNHIHVEGLQLSGGSFSWSLNEIRNPKYLVYAEPHSGTYEYDGDVAVAEIAGEKDGTVAGAYSDSTTYTKGALCIFNGRMFMSLADNNTGNTPVACTKPKNVFKNATDYWIDVTFTNTVKQNILRAASYYSEISAAATTEAKKALIEQYYDMDNVIDIALEIAAMQDSDYPINIQSTTWDGVKWYLNAYDKDRSFGISFGTHVNPPSVGSLPGGGAFDYLSLYKERTKDRWLELVDNGIFTLDNIMGTLNDWMQRIGYENYKLENDKWPAQGEYILDTVERLYHFIEQNLEVQNEFMENYV